MIDRRAFVGCLITGAVAVPIALRAQTPAKIWRVGYLASTSTRAPRYEDFVRGMAELGYTVGRNLVIEERYVGGQTDRSAKFAAELVRLSVDVIVVQGPGPLQAAREATRTIPIVMLAGSADPVNEGIAASLARPGGNVTGLTYAVSPSERFGKQLELLKEAAPRTSRVAVFWDFDLAQFRKSWESPLATAARQLGLVVLEPVQVLNEKDLEAAFATMRRQRADALLVVIGGAAGAFRGRVADAALRDHLPTVSAQKEITIAGGLLSYGPNFAEMNRRGAAFVDRIFKGTKPGDIPIELPTKHELVVNLKTAKALGLTIPQSLLLRADEVIQ